MKGRYEFGHVKTIEACVNIKTTKYVPGFADGGSLTTSYYHFNIRLTPGRDHTHGLIVIYRHWFSISKEINTFLLRFN